MAFDRIATRENARLRVAVTGTAGVGKTVSALILSKYFGSKIGLMDSENNSHKKAVGLPGVPPFVAEVLSEKNPREYLEKIQLAAEAGVEVLIIDSYSHSWIGALEIVDAMGGSKFSNGWKVVSPTITKLVDAILTFPGHVIATMRSHADYAIEQVNGRAVPKKIGMAPVARDGTDFEFDVVLDFAPGGTVTVSKTRCPALDGAVFPRNEGIPKIAETLKAWLDAGAAVLPVDTMADRIRFAQSVESLLALVPEIKALSAEDQAALKTVFVMKKNALVDAAGA